MALLENEELHANRAFVQTGISVAAIMIGMILVHDFPKDYYAPSCKNMV